MRLAVLHELGIAYITKQPGPAPTTSFSKTARVPAHATAMGKALLAYAPPLILPMISCRLTRYTSRTLTTVAELSNALHRIRFRGFAADGELDPSTCEVGVPVFDTDGVAIAAIDVRVNNLERFALEEVLPALVTAARCLGREIAAPAGTSVPPTFRPRNDRFRVNMAAAAAPVPPGLGWTPS